LAYIANSFEEVTVYSSSRLRRRADVIRAMAHPSRLLIVEALERAEMTVSNLTEIVGSDISTVSRHLSVLRSAGIVDYRREGNRNMYRLLTPCITGFLECVEQVMSQTACARTLPKEG
jgi:ArsR family transcriptional regulator